MTEVILFLIGTVAGVLFILTQWWTVNRLDPEAPRQAVLWVVGGALLRLGGLACLLVVVMDLGAVPMLIVFAGWWLARTVTLRWLTTRAQPPAEDSCQA